MGKCKLCSRPAKEGRVRCEHHLEIARRASRRYARARGGKSREERRAESEERRRAKREASPCLCDRSPGFCPVHDWLRCDVRFKCCDCGFLLWYMEFYSDRSRSRNWPRDRRCKSCSQDRGKHRYEKDPAAALARSRAWKALNRAAVNKQESRRRAKKRLLDPDWAERQRERRRKRDRERRLTDPDWVERKRLSVRKARKKRGTYSGPSKKDLYERHGGRCHWCKSDLPASFSDWHMDHVIPLSRGGTDSPENVVASCRKCNAIKAAKIVSLF